MSRIPGPAIVGLHDIFIGAVPLRPANPAPGAAPGATMALPAGGQRLTVLVKPGARPGATPGKAAPGPQMAQGPGPKPGQLAKPAPKVNKGGNNKDGFAHAKAAAFNAMKAGDKAIAAAKKAATSVKKYGTAVKLGYHAPLVPLELVGVMDDGQVVLGAAAPAKKALTPAQTKAVQKHTALVAKTAQSAQRLARLAKTAAAAGQAANQAAKKTTGAIANALKLKGKPPAMVGGVDADLAVLGLYYEFVGAGPDPDAPGYLTDGSIDPAVLMGDGAVFDLGPPTDPGMADPNAPAQDPAFDPSAYELPPEAGQGAVVAPDGTVLYDPANDPEVIPIPQRGATMTPEEAFETWQHVPNDAIIYNGEGPGWPETGVASWNFFYGPKTGNGEYGDGYYQGPSNQWWARNNGAMFPKGNTFPVEQDSTTRNWGPLVGKPTSPLAGLQFATIDKKWFWQGKYAPKFASRETDQAIEDANNAIIKANRAAALVQAAQMQKDAFEQAQAKAKQDAANALALSAADTQSQISQKQVEAQTQQLDVQTQKAELDALKLEAQMAAQQQQAELQAAQQQAQLDAQAQHALITQADVWNQWAKQNPAEAVQQMQQGLAPGGPAYGPPAYDDEYYEGEYYEASDNDGPRMYGPGGGGGGGEEEDGGGEYDAEGD